MASSECSSICRRSVLGASLVGAAGVATATLAACSSSSTQAASAPTTAEPSTADAIGNVTPTATTATTTAESGVVLGKVADIPVGGGVIFTDKKVVVTRPTTGDVLGFTAVCTHQGCTVSTVTNGTIGCACHGSEFSAKDGSVVKGPASDPLAKVKVSVVNDAVVLD